LTHIKQQKFLLSHKGPWIISTALDVTEGIFAVLYVSIMGLHVFVKRQFFLHLLYIVMLY